MTNQSDNWVDPRSHPQPPALPRAIATEPAEVEGLLDLCKSGCIYAIEQRLAEGRPIQAASYLVRGRPCHSSPASVAIETGQQDLLKLLLCNGYQPDRDEQRPLDLALRGRHWAAVELLLQWGADASRVYPDTVFDTYRTDLFERFWAAGVDYARDDSLAHYLAATTSNRPLYGWVRRHRDDPGMQRMLAMALVQAVWKGKEKAVHLLRWAGADWHLKVPLLEWRNPDTPDDEEDLCSAVQTAIDRGEGKLLKLLPLDSARDPLEEMWAEVRDALSADYLIAVGPPVDWSPTILRNLALVANNVFTDWTDRCRQCLQRIAFHGGRLTSAEPMQRTLLRKSIIRMDRSDARRWLLYWLSNPRHCDPDIYADLVRTPKMREILGASGLSRPARKGGNVR